MGDITAPETRSTGSRSRSGRATNTSQDDQGTGGYQIFPNPCHHPAENGKYAAAIQVPINRMLIGIQTGNSEVNVKNVCYLSVYLVSTGPHRGIYWELTIPLTVPIRLLSQVVYYLPPDLSTGGKNLRHRRMEPWPC